MHIVFLDDLGCYAAVAAGGFFSGVLSPNPTPSEIAHLPNFAAHRDLQVGRFYHLGTDKQGNQLYGLGTRGNAQLFLTAANDLLKILQEDDIRLVDVSGFNPPLVRAMAIAKTLFPLEPFAVRTAARSLARVFPQLVHYLVMDSPVKNDLTLIPG